METHHEFEKLQEEQTEPTTGKKIGWLVDSTSNYIVFLDDDDYVWWAWNGDFGDTIRNLSQVVGRIASLEAIDLQYLGVDQRQAFKRLVGEGMAAALNSKKADAAIASLNEAERYIKARNQELARQWHVTFSFFSILSPVLLSFVVWWAATHIKSLWGPHLFELLLMTGPGALGAFLSIILRVGDLKLDVSAGRWLYFVESICRVLAGVIGAWFVTLCFQGELLLGVVTKTPQRTVVLVTLAMLAGVSERLVPELIKRLEGSVDNPSAPAPKD